MLVSLFSLVAVGLAAQPAAAQPSATAELINGLNADLLYLAVPITVLVEAILIYTVLKYRNAEEASPTRENRRLEITWTIATAVVLLFVGVASYGVLANPNVTYTGDQPIAPEDDDVVVLAEAYQWGWDMQYPQHGNFSNGNTVVVPADQDVYIQVTSRDVIHAFHAPELGLKQDAMPGNVNVIKTEDLEEGTYQGYCAEFCGVAHSQMYFTVEVVPQDEYEQFVEENTQESSSGGSGSGNSTATATASN